MSTHRPESSSPEAQTGATQSTDAIADAERVAPRGLSRRAVLGLARPELSPQE